MGDQPKVEPSAVARASAKAIHEMFVALVDEGFTEPQALAIVAQMLRNANGGA